MYLDGVAVVVEVCNVDDNCLDVIVVGQQAGSKQPVTLTSQANDDDADDDDDVCSRATGANVDVAQIIVGIRNQNVSCWCLVKPEMLVLTTFTNLNEANAKQRAAIQRCL